MEECNKSYGANNHTSLLSHAQSQSPGAFTYTSNVVTVYSLREFTKLTSTN